MSPAIRKTLCIAAVAWMVGVTAYYCFAFSRDFYAANRDGITALLHRAGLE